MGGGGQLETHTPKPSLHLILHPPVPPQLAGQGRAVPAAVQQHQVDGVGAAGVEGVCLVNAAEGGAAGVVGLGPQRIQEDLLEVLLVRLPPVEVVGPVIVVVIGAACVCGGGGSLFVKVVFRVS